MVSYLWKSLNVATGFQGNQTNESDNCTQSANKASSKTTHSQQSKTKTSQIRPKLYNPSEKSLWEKFCSLFSSSNSEPRVRTTQEGLRDIKHEERKCEKSLTDAEQNRRQQLQEQLNLAAQNKDWQGMQIVAEKIATFNDVTEETKKRVR